MMNHYRFSLRHRHAAGFVTGCLLNLFLPNLFAQNIPAAANQPEPAKPEALAPFVETIPGTAVKFEMIPLPAGAVTLTHLNQNDEDNSIEIKPIWIGKTG